MANFQTHLWVGSSAGASLGTAAILAGGQPWWIGAALAGLTALSSLLPDLDADSSRPATMLWQGTTLFGGVAIAQSAWSYSSELPTAILLGFMGGILIRYGCSFLAMRLLRHRGWFHSLQAAWLWGVFGVFALTRTEAVDDHRTLGWVFVALFVGYIVHLALDELYSVDLNNVKIRRSFGTALKIWDGQKPVAGVILSLLCIWSIWNYAELGREIWLAGLWKP